MEKENAEKSVSTAKDPRTDGIPFSHNLFLEGEATVVTPPPAPAAEESPAAMMTKPRQLQSTTLEGDVFLRDASLEGLLKKYKPSTLSQQRYGKGVSLPRLEGPLKDIDILFGRGNRVGAHPGNRVMREVVSLNQSFYRRVAKEQKALIGDALVGYFESRGTRFVEAVGPGEYRHVAYPRVIEKIMQALREKHNYRTVEHKPVKPTPARSQNTKALLGKAGKEHREKLSSGMSSLRDRKKKTKKKEEQVKVSKPVKVTKPVKISPPSTSKAVPPKKPGRKPKNADKGPQTPWGNIRPGDKLGIYWELDRIYYPGTVESVVGPKAWILYDDGEKELVDLSKNKHFKWRESLNRRLHPPAPSDANTQLSGPNRGSVSSKRSRGQSLGTQDSTDSGSGRKYRKAREGKPISIQGTFVAPVVASAPSLASFLRNKIDSPDASKKVKNTVVASESAAPAPASFARTKMEASSSGKVTSTKSTSEQHAQAAAPCLMSFLSSKMQVPSGAITKT